MKIDFKQFNDQKEKKIILKKKTNVKNMFDP